MDLGAFAEIGDVASARDAFVARSRSDPHDRALWDAWLCFEEAQGAAGDYARVLATALCALPADVSLWLRYVAHVRATTDGETDEGRTALAAAYEAALAAVGIDARSGPLYRGYVSAVRDGWRAESVYEQQLQMDALRRVYQRAAGVPHAGLEALWAEYDAWENSLNRATARKIVADRAPAYMAARAVVRELTSLVDAVEAADAAVAAAVGGPLLDAALDASWDAHRAWIRWEESNPLNVPANASLLHARIAHAYRAALSSPARRRPELWLSWRVAVARKPDNPDTTTVLREALALLPADILIGLAVCDSLELASCSASDTAAESSEPAAKSPPAAPQTAALGLPEPMDLPAPPPLPSSADEAYAQLTDRLVAAKRPADAALAAIHHMWHARRTSGIAAARAVFTAARKRPAGSFSHHVFVAAAHMETDAAVQTAVASSPAAAVATRIFELGMARHGSSGAYVASYLSHVLDVSGDAANGRALFERVALAGALVDAEMAAVWRVLRKWTFLHADAATRAALDRRFCDATGADSLALLVEAYTHDDLVPLGGSAPGEALPVDDGLRLFGPHGRVGILMRALAQHAPFDGPRIDVAALVTALASVDLPALTLPPAPADRSGASASSAPRTSHSAGFGRKRARAADDDADDEPVHVPLRADDIFAQRRAKRVH